MFAAPESGPNQFIQFVSIIAFLCKQYNRLAHFDLHAEKCCAILAKQAILQGMVASDCCMKRGMPCKCMENAKAAMAILFIGKGACMRQTPCQ